MAHTYTWNADFEANPTDNNYGYEIDDYIRKLALSVRERIAIDHYMDIAGTDADHGEHSKVTLRVGSAPTYAANKGFLYAKDVSSKAELHYLDEDNNEIQLTSGGTLTVANYKTIWIPASAFTENTTNGAVASYTEFATNDIMAEFFAFDDATEQYIGTWVAMPEDWNLGTVKAKFYWAPADDTGSVGDTVEWEIAGLALSNADTIDAAPGTSQVISDALLTGESGTMHVSGATPAITIGGTPAAGDLIYLKVSRNVGGTDSFASDARLFGVLLQIGITNAKGTAW